MNTKPKDWLEYWEIVHPESMLELTKKFELDDNDSTSSEMHNVRPKKRRIKKARYRNRIFTAKARRFLVLA